MPQPGAVPFFVVTGIQGAVQCHDLLAALAKAVGQRTQVARRLIRPARTTQLQQCLCGSPGIISAAGTFQLLQVFFYRRPVVLRCR